MMMLTLSTVCLPDSLPPFSLPSPFLPTFLCFFLFRSVHQRKGEEILRAMLPPKEELVLYLRASEEQLRLYRSLLAHHAERCPAQVQKASDGGEREGEEGGSEKEATDGEGVRRRGKPEVLETRLIILQTY